MKLRVYDFPHIVKKKSRISAADGYIVLVNGRLVSNGHIVEENDSIAATTSIYDLPLKLPPPSVFLDEAESTNAHLCNGDFVARENRPDELGIAKVMYEDETYVHWLSGVQEYWPYSKLLRVCLLASTEKQILGPVLSIPHSDHHPTIPTFAHYRELAERTDKPEFPLEYFAGCLCEEAGEFFGHVKKHVWHKHPMTSEMRAKMVEELGDALWYLDRCAHRIGVTLDEIAPNNIMKLRMRYPDGFSFAKSIHRKWER